MITSLLGLEWQTQIAGGPENYGLTYTTWHDTNCIVVFKSKIGDRYHYRHTESVQRGSNVAVLTIVDTRYRSGGGWADREEAKRRAESYLYNFLRGAFVR